jgi:hypothetical protein
MDIGYFKVSADWPPKEELPRLVTYENNRKLWEGDHEEVFRARWEKLLRAPEDKEYRMSINAHRRITTLFADLVFGREPTYKSKETDYLDSLIGRDTSEPLQRISYEVAQDFSRYGVGIYKVYFDGARSRIAAQPPCYWFPVVNPMNIKEIEQHIIAYRYKMADGFYLAVEVHERGKLTQETWAMNRDGTRIIALEGEPIEQATGVDDFLVFPCINSTTSDSLFGKDDYSDINEVVSELEVRHAQVSRVQDKNADPVLTGPRTAIKMNPDTGKPFVDIVGGRYIGGTKDDMPYSYLTWDGMMSANFTEVGNLMELMYFLSETSPAAFGKLEQGLAASGAALRRMMIPTLAKVDRMKMAIAPALRGAMIAASCLDKERVVAGAVELEDLSVTLNTGLPIDPSEVLVNQTTLLSAGLTTKKRAVMELFGMNEDDAEQFVIEIAAETKAERPPAPEAPPVTPFIQINSIEKQKPVTPSANLVTEPQTVEQKSLK